jgi:hypothetical protein
MLSKVFIQRKDGEILDESCFSAWQAFRAKGYEVAFFEGHEMSSGRLALTRTTLVVGSVPKFEAALRQIGVRIPAPLNIPSRLAPYAGRRVWPDTLGNIRRQLRQGASTPFFIKPRAGTKTFDGHVIVIPEMLTFTCHLPDDLELEVSEYVCFVSEWRCFVHRGQIIGVRHYNGDWARYPSAEVIRASVQAYEGEAPVAYAIDIGVTANEQTLLVEVNDAYSLGSYGLRAMPYATMLEDRWLELVGESA